MPNNSDVLDTYGWTLFQSGKVDEAEVTLVRAMQADRPAPVVRYHLGSLYEKRTDWEKAKVQYQLGLSMLSDEDKREEVAKQLKDGLDRVQDKLKK
jgi:Tfp pilus assembly protein PilF